MGLGWLHPAADSSARGDKARADKFVFRGLAFTKAISAKSISSAINHDGISQEHSSKRQETVCVDAFGSLREERKVVGCLHLQCARMT